jgi:hypothetical protein
MLWNFSGIICGVVLVVGLRWGRGQSHPAHHHYHSHYHRDLDDCVDAGGCAFVSNDT